MTTVKRPFNSFFFFSFYYGKTTKPKRKKPTFKPLLK